MPSAPVPVAWPKLRTFARRRGKGPVELAMHAAVPLGLTPELLNLIRVNFVAGAHFIAETDLLLSDLVHPLGGGYYELDPEVRDILLEQLSEHPEIDGGERLIAVAEFLYSYCRERLRGGGAAGERDYLLAQQWAALAHLNPAEAAEGLARALEAGMSQGDGGEIRRIAALSRTLAGPLRGAGEIVRYASGVERMIDGDRERARLVFQLAGVAGKHAVGVVELMAPTEIAAAFQTPAPTADHWPDHAVTEEPAAEEEKRKQAISALIAILSLRAEAKRRVEEEAQRKAKEKELRRAERGFLGEVRRDLAALRSRLAKGEIDEEVFQRQRQLILDDLTSEEQARLEKMGGLDASSSRSAADASGPTAPLDDSRAVRDAIPSLADLNLEPGTVLFDQWRIVHELGRGAFGVVFEAKDIHLEQAQAVKVLDPAMVAREDLLARFRRAVALMRRLIHRRVVRIYDYREDLEQKLALISMELVPGGSAKDLRNVARKASQPLPLRLILQILGQTLEALAAAHAQDVVHYDVTPGNILLAGGPPDELLSDPERNPEVKLVDLGISVLVERSELSQRDRVLGNAAYAAPEALDPGVGDQGPPADIYGLGAVIYELLTGEPPLGRFEEPSALRPGLPAQLEELVLSMLSRRPSQRPSAAEALEQWRRIAGPSEEEAQRRAEEIEAELRTDEAEALTQFEHDIFISYADIDDQPLLERQDGWVSNLHRALALRVAQLLGKEPRIWRDGEHAGRDVLTDRSLETLRASAIVVAVLSPRYVRSDRCRRELEEFMKAAEQSGGWMVENRSRVFKVVKTPVPVEQHPEELQRLLGYEFFTVDPDTGRARELGQASGKDPEPEYWHKLDDLAHDIADMLRRLEAGGESGPRPGDERTTSQELLEPAPVFLSYASEDQETAKRLRDALEAAGLDVFFDKDNLKAGDEWKATVRRSIKACSFFIPVISRNASMRPEGYFRAEWRWALEKAEGRTPEMAFIIPVVIDDTSPDEPGLPNDFRDLHWTRLPEGEASPEFVEHVRRHYRRYQEILAGL